MKTNDHRSLAPTHLNDDEIISYLDGETEVQSQDEIQSHLESCWDCRVRLSAYERSIENFLHVRQRTLPSQLPPSGPALELFRERLSAHRALTPSHSLLRDGLTGFRSFSRRFINLLNISNYSLRTQILATRGIAATVLTCIVVGFVLLSFRATTVSASELLRLSIEAQDTQLGKTTEPVVHQKIKVSRSSTGGASIAPVTWDVWNDTTNLRVKSVADSETQTPLTTSTAQLLVNDLRTILRSNGMNEHRPLSAASYKSWTDSLTAKIETVSSASDANDSEILTITTISNRATENGRISEARIVFRGTDHHPKGLYIKVGTPTGGQSFELEEDHFEIVSLRSLDPSVFADPTKIEVASRVGNEPRPETNSNTQQALATNTNLNANTNVEPATPRMPVATTEAEVEVLDLLNKVGADISEQLNVTRTADGHLIVEGLVETDKRKKEILQALSPVAGNRAVRIRIQTIEEATIALQKQKQQSQPGTVDRVEIEKGRLAVDSELREYFARQGGDVEAQIRGLSSRVINRSRSALFQASALNRMSNRFSAAQVESLTPEARTKLLNILKGYAASVRRETAALRAELQPVFGGFSDGRGESITSDADLIASAKRLYDLASQTDSAVRSAFALSNTAGSVSAVKSPQFRRNLAGLQSLAAAIEKAR